MSARLTRYGSGTCSETTLYQVAEILAMAIKAAGSAHARSNEDMFDSPVINFSASPVDAWKHDRVNKQTHVVDWRFLSKLERIGQSFPHLNASASRHTFTFNINLNVIYDGFAAPTRPDASRDSVHM